MKAVLDYLKREPCTACKIRKGTLTHCETHATMYQKALTEAEELGKMPTYMQRQEAAKERILIEYNMKVSHTWASSKTFTDPARTRMSPYPSHCIRCGLSMTMFKAKPQECPKKNAG